jgi:hypothetical protein
VDIGLKWNVCCHPGKSEQSQNKESDLILVDLCGVHRARSVLWQEYSAVALVFSI